MGKWREREEEEGGGRCCVMTKRLEVPESTCCEDF